MCWNSVLLLVRHHQLVNIWNCQISCAPSFIQLKWYPGVYIPIVLRLKEVAEPQRARESGREKLLTVWPCLLQRSASGAGFSMPPICAYWTQTSIDFDRSRSCSSTHLSTLSLWLLGFSIMLAAFSLSLLLFPLPLFTHPSPPSFPTAALSIPFPEHENQTLVDHTSDLQPAKAERTTKTQFEAWINCSVQWLQMISLYISLQHPFPPMN